MLPHDTAAPDLEAFEKLARDAFDALPGFVREQCLGLVVAVAEEAEPDVLADLGMDDPLMLTGLYDGIALTERSVFDPPRLPDTVWLYRQAILAEWRDRGNVALDALVAHVLVHEIAHHFGYSDDEIARIDPWWL